MRTTLRLLCTIAVTVSSLTAADAADSPVAAARAGIDAVVNRLAGNGTASAARNAVVQVSAPRLGFEYATAAGIARADDTAAMTAARPFYIASITKPMVATRILQLVEAGKLSLDTTLAQTGILPPDALGQLQVYEGHSYGGEITIRQLLQHRTGLRDMLLDDREHLSDEFESGTAPGSLGGIWSSQLARYLECHQHPGTCPADEVQRLYPGHRWTAWNGAAWQRNPRDRDAGLINFFLSEMDRAGLFPPGQGFHYADTNYILLGMLIEHISGRSLHAELRDSIFAPLGMRHTYLSYAPDADARPLDLAPADFWVGGVPVISNGLDISFDWAGGGVVTTAADLNRFLRGVQSGKVFRHATTRDQMLQCVDTPSRTGRHGGYGLGIRCVDTEYGSMWGHMGAWGSVMLLFPDQDVSITGTVDRLFDNDAMQTLLFGSMAALKSAGLLPASPYGRRDSVGRARPVTSPATLVSDTRRLSRRVLLGYGVGSLGTGIYSSTPGVLLLFFMTDTLGIPASLAALGVSLPKFWDMFADPIVGALSDRTRSRWGRRRPWLLGGSLLMLVSYIFLFTVPRFASTFASFLYVTGMFALSATAYAIFAVPYTAMAAEMSDSSQERVRIMAYRMTLVLLGILAGSALAPMLVGALGGGRGGYAGMSIVIGSVAAGAMLLAFFSTRRVQLHEQPVEHLTWREQVRLVLRNRQFLCLLGVYLVQLLALGTMTAAAPYFAVHVLGQDEGLIGRMFLVLIGVGVLSMPFWSAMARRFGKKRAYVGASLLYAAASLGILAVRPGGNPMSLYVPLAFMGLAFGAQQMLPFAMLTDVINVDADTTGARREGLLSGLWVASEKAGLALGPLVAGLTLDATGFIESTGATVAQSAGAQSGIRMAYAVIPAVVIALSLVLLRHYRSQGEQPVEAVTT